MTAQKKGQSEFVEFIEPKPASQLKHVETYEKRVSSEVGAHRSIYNPMVHTGNFLFIGLFIHIYHYADSVKQQCSVIHSDVQKIVFKTNSTAGGMPLSEEYGKPFEKR